MKYKRLIPILMMISLSGCLENVQKDSKDDELVLRLDSMQDVIEGYQYRSSLLEQIGKHMDSIDANRNWIKINLETGIASEDYEQRMKNLNAYVQKAEWTIGELEKTRSAYASQVKRLRREIELKNDEIQALQLSVAKYQEQNTALLDLLVITEDELIEARDDMEVLHTAYELASTEIKNLLINVQLTEAESFYARAQGMELVASHIQLAPRRKRKALEDALGLYSTSFEKGYQPAEIKMTDLKKKLGLS